MTPAFIIVDLQVDFCSPKGEAVRRKKRISEIHKILPKIERFYTALKKQDIPVFFTQFIYHEDKSPHTLRRHVARGFNPMCISGTEGENFYPIVPSSDDIIIQKYHYDPFQDTNLAEILRARNIDHVYVAGVRTELCVDITAKRAVSEGFHVTVVEDLVATYDDKYLYHDAFIQLFGKYYGAVETASHILTHFHQI